MTHDQPTCSTCRAYVRSVQDVMQGECHAQPPQVLMAPVQSPQGVVAAPVSFWPSVKCTGFCLQHRPAISLANGSAGDQIEAGGAGRPYK